MSEYEKNVYTNLFEYPTKHIVKLELENEEKDKEINRLNNKIKEQNLLLIEFQDMEQKLKLKDNIIKIMEKYFELIIDLGYDYDGLNEEKSLKKLIDELCKYASLGRTYNITEPIYVNENKKYNILHEELKKSDNNE